MMDIHNKITIMASTIVLQCAANKRIIYTNVEMVKAQVDFRAGILCCKKNN